MHEAALTAWLTQQQQQGLWRQHTQRGADCGRWVRYEGRDYLNFSSNDYLGISHRPELGEAAAQGFARYGAGSGSANTLTGYTEAHHALSEALAAWLQRDSVLLFPSGYQANLALLTAFANKDTTIVCDRRNHASLWDGVRLSGARFKRYRQAQQAGDKLPADGQGILLTESVFSMEGDAAALNFLAQIAQEKSSLFLVDEAHGLGVFGAQGAGCVAAAGLTQQDVPVIMGSFGKALGVGGAMLAGRKAEMEYLLQSARPYLFTTALSPMLVCAVHASVQIVQQAEPLRAHLHHLIAQFKQHFKGLSAQQLLPSDSPIQALILPALPQAEQLSQALKNAGILAPLIRYPTVPKESPRIRFSLNAQHTAEDIAQVCNTVLEFLYAHDAIF